MFDPRSTHARMRSIIEVPIMVERFWSKVPTLPADAIMIDLEDSATPEQKVPARERALAALAHPEQFGTRTTIVRVNNLDTPWGADDLSALGAADGDFIVSYPKAASAREVAAVSATLRDAGRARSLHVMVESPAALQAVDEIAGAPDVAGLHFGYVDFAAVLGSRPFNRSGTDLQDGVGVHARAVVSTAAAAHGLFSTGGTLLPDIKDLAAVRAFVRSWVDCGYTACIALSPAHLEAVNAEFAPDAEQVVRARELCSSYEEAVRGGAPAVMVNGRVVTLPDYRVAVQLLARAGETRGAGSS